MKKQLSKEDQEKLQERIATFKEKLLQDFVATPIEISVKKKKVAKKKTVTNKNCMAQRY